MNISIKRTVALSIVCSLISGKLWAPPSVSITKAQNIDFSNLDFVALPGTASVGTDGTISYNGSLSGSGVGTAGQFTLSGKGGATVADLSCGTTITLCDTSSNTVDITGTELAVTSSRGGYGSGTACAGVGNVVLPSVTVKGAASGRTYYVGGVLSVGAAGPPAFGAFSSANACGTPLVIEAVIP